MSQCPLVRYYILLLIDNSVNQYSVHRVLDCYRNGRGFESTNTSDTLTAADSVLFVNGYLGKPEHPGGGTG